MDIISSEQNPLIKEIKNLKRKKYREELKKFYIEGLRFVEEALDVSNNIDRIIVSEQFYSNRDNTIMDRIKQMRLQTAIVKDKLFKELADTENPQGILAVLKMPSYSMNDVFDESCDMLVVLDSIQDPGNMGTIIRTADAAGAGAVIISKGCVDVYNPKVMRSTMGSVFHIPLIFADDLVSTINTLKSKGYIFMAAHLKGTKNYFDMDMTGKIAIIIGNEANGISDEISSISDKLVKIPMPGKAESLNASIAASILIYESVRL